MTSTDNLKSQSVNDNHMVRPKDVNRPVTVFAKHVVRQDREMQFQRWYKDVLSMQAKNKGYIGSEVVKPMDSNSDEYVSIFSYDSYENLKAWMDSEERQEMMERVSVIDREPVQFTYHSLEYWFDEHNTSATPSCPQNGEKSQPPPRWKMAILTFFLIWFQVHFALPLVGRIKAPEFALEAIGVFCIVMTTSYVLMPLFTKYVFFWFLYPKRDQAQVEHGTESSSDRGGSNREHTTEEGTIPPV